MSSYFFVTPSPNQCGCHMCMVPFWGRRRGRGGRSQTPSRRTCSGGRSAAGSGSCDCGIQNSQISWRTLLVQHILELNTGWPRWFDAQNWIVSLLSWLWSAQKKIGQSWQGKLQISVTPQLKSTKCSIKQTVAMLTNSPYITIIYAVALISWTIEIILYTCFAKRAALAPRCNSARMPPDRRPHSLCSRRCSHRMRRRKCQKSGPKSEKTLQVDTSGCGEPPVDCKTKVPPPGQAKTELMFWSQGEVLLNLMCHPVE